MRRMMTSTTCLRWWLQSGPEGCETGAHGDVEGKRKPQDGNKNRDFNLAKLRFDRFYFPSNKVYSEIDFERRLRIPRLLCSRVEAALSGLGVFTEGRDTTGKEVINRRIKLIYALWMLTCGSSFDQMDELYELSAKSTRNAYMSFIDEAMELFSDEYLRRPTGNDLRRILAIKSSRGFSGCVGSWDCQHWNWKNFPVAWAGQ